MGVSSDLEGDTPPRLPAADLATVALPPQVPVAREAPVGDRLGVYPVAGSLGVGGMGEVLEVRDLELGRTMAAKVALDQADPETLRKLVREARITGRIDHPCIPAVHELGLTEDGRVFFTMKHVRGRDLAAILASERDALLRSGVPEWSWSRLLAVFAKVCDAVAYAHAKGIVHRDLKPANVMVGAFGEVYVMDWGLARVVGSPAPGAEPPPHAAPVASVPGATLEGTILGTPAYMPPEQARGEVSRVDARSDVYALGAILYEMLALAPPYVGTSATSVVAKVVGEALVPPGRRTPGRAVPWELEAIVLRAMAYRAADRYADASALAADVSRYADGRRVAAARYGPVAVVRKWTARHPFVARVAMVVVLASGVVGGVATWHTRALRARLLRDAAAAAEAGRGDVVLDRLARARALDPADLAPAVALRALATRLVGVRLDGPGGPAALAAEWAARDASDDEPVDTDAARAARAGLLDRYLADVAWLDHATALAPDDQDVRALRARAGEGLGWCALLATDYTLAHHAFTALAGFGEATRGAALAANVARDRNRRVDRWTRRAGLALDDVAAGLARPERPPGAPLWDDYLIELATYRDPRVAVVVGARLDALTLAHAGGASWSVPARDGVRLACHVLGRLGFAESVPPLARALERLADAELAAEAGLALCNPRRVEAGPPLAAARARLGPNSQAWRAIARMVSRIPASAPDPATAGSAFDWGQRGYELRERNDLAGALVAFERALSLDPASEIALVGRGQLRIARGELAGAVEDFGRAIEVNPRAEYYLNRGLALHHLGRFADAIVDCDRAIAIAPTQAVAYMNRGLVHQALGNRDAALADLDQAIALDPRLAVAYDSRGILHHARGDASLALADFDRAIALDARCAATYANRGKVRHGLGDVPGALDDFDRAIALDPRNAGAYVGRGLARHWMKDLDGAIADYDMALTLEPGLALAHTNRSSARRDRGDLDGALADAARGVELDPTSAHARAHLGHVRLARRDWAGARADYDAALVLGSKDWLTYVHRAGARRMMGDIDGALGDLDRALELDPDALPALIDRSGLRLQRREVDLAEPDVARILALDPRSAAGHGNLGVVRMLRGDHAGAILAFDRAIELDERPWQPWLYRGRERAMVGRVDLGLADVRHARGLAPEEARAGIDRVIRELEAMR